MKTRTRNTPAIADSRQALVEAIEVYIAREGLTRTGFGAAALDDPSFLGRLGRGSDMRLCTADKVLAFLGKETIGPRFRREVEAFLSVTRIKPHLFGEEAVGDPTFVARLRRGRSPGLATVDRVGAWMAETASAAEMAAVRAVVEDGAPAAPLGEAGGEATEMDSGGGYMTTKQAADFLGLSPRTLDRYRGNGKGPPFYRFGACVRYLLAEVKRWASEWRRRSTSDDGLRRPR